MAGRILIVDDVATNRIMLNGWLSSAFHETLLASSGQEALHSIDAQQPDLVLLDLHLPDLDGCAVLERLRADPRHRELPVIVHTAATDCGNRLAALRAGADDVLEKPIDVALLLARIRALLRRRDVLPAPAMDALQDAATPFDWPAAIYLAALRHPRAASLRDGLQPLLPHALFLRDHATLLGSGLNDGAPPDAYLLDATEDAQTASALLSELRSTVASRETGIAIIVPEAWLAPLAYDLGADEAFLPDTPAAEIALRLDALLRRSRAAAFRRASLHDQARLAMTDPLTGLHNRRYALRRMGEMSANAVAIGQGFTVLLADLDRFKQVNDRYGHGAGDAVLAEVANRLRRCMNPGDLLARIGGEEFLIALPATTRAAAADRARRLCDSVGSAPFALPDGRSVAVTLSIGLAESSPGILPDRAIENADRALLAAKTQGRNRVIVSRSAA